MQYDTVVLDTIQLYLIWQRRPVDVKHDAYMHHGQVGGSQKTKKNENRRGIYKFCWNLGNMVSLALGVDSLQYDIA